VIEMFCVGGAWSVTQLSQQAIFFFIAMV